jgi:hypothetical protein
MTTKTPKQPWERRRGEPVAAYTHFLFYRNLGPARSIDGAYAAYLATSEVNDIATDGGAAKRGKTRRAPGNWWREAADYEWQSGAAAWDVSVLAEEGRAAVVMFVAVVRDASRRLLGAMCDPNMTIQNWSQIADLITVIGAHIPTELVQRAALPSQGGDQRARHAGT